MSQINYSIVIPHYNIPELLGRCLRSIPEREDVQVIVVDDCSPCANELQSLVPELYRKDVELYSTPKGGSAGRARNVGLDYAKGKWLLFMDADDLYPENFDEQLKCCVDRPEDILYFRTKSVMSDDINQISGRNIYEVFFDDYLNTGNESELRYSFHAQWGKIIKHQFVKENNIRFEETRYSNDYLFGVKIGHYAKSIAVFDEIGYLVTERAGSLTSQFVRSMEELVVRYEVAVHVMDFLETQNLPIKRWEYCEYLIQIRKRSLREYLRLFTKLSIKYKYIFLKYRLSCLKR